MRIRNRITILLLKRMFLTIAVSFFIAGLVTSVSAIGLGDLKDKAEKKVEKRADDKADEAMDDALDKAEGKDNKNGKTEAEKKTSENEGASNKAASLSQMPGEGAWLNYDFVPGDKILFYDDFSKTRVGDFPRRIEFIKGNIEVAEWNGEKYMRLTAASDFKLPLPTALGEQFTMETEVHLPTHHTNIRVFGGLGDARHLNETNYIFVRGNGTAGIDGAGGGKTDTRFPREWVNDGVAQFKIMADGPYFKVYVNDQRVANIPNVNFNRDKFLHFTVSASTDHPVLFSYFRVAEGGRKFLYDELELSGRVATQGIYFDSGSDRLRPESTPTLTDIATMLKDHPELKLLIEGHTDAIGDDEFNLDLSRKRAASVKKYLVENHGIDATRLETQGFGEQNPVDSNDTPEGRQNNRRVELVKL